MRTSNPVAAGAAWWPVPHLSAVVGSSVRLVAELSAVAGCGATVGQLLPLVAAASGHRHYSHHLQLLETVCRSLPPTAAGLGKRPFKMHLELFMDAIFDAVVRGGSMGGVCPQSEYVLHSFDCPSLSSAHDLC